MAGHSSTSKRSCPRGEDAEAGLDAFYPDAPELVGVQPDSLRAGWTVVLRTEQQAPGYWTVTVAADVQGKSGAHWADLGTRYYSVVVAGQAGHYSTTQLPSEVPSPGGATTPELALPAPEGVAGPAAISSTIRSSYRPSLAARASSPVTR